VTQKVGAGITIHHQVLPAHLAGMLHVGTCQTKGGYVLRKGSTAQRQRAM